VDWGRVGQGTWVRKEVGLNSDVKEVGSRHRTVSWSHFEALKQASGSGDKEVKTRE
jgi:hypothetical protein